MHSEHDLSSDVDIKQMFKDENYSADCGPSETIYGQHLRLTGNGEYKVPPQSRQQTLKVVHFKPLATE